MQKLLGPVTGVEYTLQKIMGIIVAAGYLQYMLYACYIVSYELDFFLDFFLEPFQKVTQGVYVHHGISSSQQVCGRGALLVIHF